MSSISNIAIASNVYIRTASSVEDDSSFVKNVHGRAALSALKQYTYGTLSKTRLTEAQKCESSDSATCGPQSNKRKETTYGPVLVDGQVVWACRCENTDCAHYFSCMSSPHAKQIVRTADAITLDAEETESLSLAYECFGLDFSTMKPFTEVFAARLTDDSAIETQPIEEAIIKDQSFFETCNEYTTIEAPTIIIESPITSKILVNAGPGTGKTYTAIRRLEYIVKHNLADFPWILVLCYTNAAKNVIVDRIETGISSCELPSEARNIHIHTLDSFASMYLSAIEEDFSGLDHNKRINLFNKTISPEWFDEFEYVIIDELQDLVNQRALMTLNILQAITCSYLLLGDRCQAIYDYDCAENATYTVDSVEFYKRLSDFLPPEAEKYELTRNMRQSTELAKFTNDLRYALLNFDAVDTNFFMAEELEDLPRSSQPAEDLIPVPLSGTQTAILCRNNGEAEYLSAILHRKQIRHTLLRGASQSVSLSRWIADVFWDYCEPRISINDFVERYSMRVSEAEGEAMAAYQALSTVCGNSEITDYLKIDSIVKGLKSTAVLPAMTINAQPDELTVSTIHKAKGREFDQVYLLKSRFKESENNTEEARVWYVGTTRPKQNLEMVSKKNLSNWYFKVNSYGRRFRTLVTYRTYCANLVVGMPDDVDTAGFVDADLCDPIELQNYIATNIKVNDPVEVILDEGVYYITHKGKRIGKLASDIVGDFWSAINMTGNKSNIPPRLHEIYVANIVSEIQKQFSERVPIRFRESRVWLGIEITGFAKADWRYGEWSDV